MPQRRQRARRPNARRASGRVVTATEAAKNFGTIVDRVREERAVYVVERSGKPVAQIGPVETKVFTLRDLADLLASTPKAVEEGIAFFQWAKVPKNRWAR